jgi:DNA-binding transcriptional MerR regulator
VARPDELIGIGEFARRARQSVKQLRSYDELGLPTPPRSASSKEDAILPAAP